MEPLAIVLLSAIMTLASLQLINESVQKIIGLANKTKLSPTVDLVTIIIAGLTVGRSSDKRNLTFNKLFYHRGEIFKFTDREYYNQWLTRGVKTVQNLTITRIHSMHCGKITSVTR